MANELAQFASSLGQGANLPASQVFAPGGISGLSGSLPAPNLNNVVASFAPGGAAPGAAADDFTGNIPSVSQLTPQNIANRTFDSAAIQAFNTQSAMRVTLTTLDTTFFNKNSGGPGILKILGDTGGMIFPYTPQVSFSQAVNYADLQLVHSNTDYPTYTRTPSVTISVNGKFSVQNQREGQYALACIHFLRAVSKMRFGENDNQAGLPPPILLFSGYGKYLFNSLRVVLKSHSWAFDDTVDFVTVNVGNDIVRLPALFTIQCELTVVQTPQRMRQTFNFDKFASGELLSQGGWI